MKTLRAHRFIGAGWTAMPVARQSWEIPPAILGV